MTIEEAWKIIHQDYVDLSKIDSAALSQAAVQAMIETLNDPHSAWHGVLLAALARELRVSGFFSPRGPGLLLDSRPELF